MKPIIISAIILMLAGCNTIEGIGQDVSSAGDFLSDAADNTQDLI